ncbi:hypothetical protein AMECASPLE_025431 [Ameca splendens]|uniref:Uncharacterized protein n=1 Tax=Ameca splendens TaxID=208324 RepID=A0ABV1ABT5_9TELE
MVAKKYEEQRERVKMEEQQAVAITFGNISTSKWAGRPKVPQLLPSRRSRDTWQRAITPGPRILRDTGTTKRQSIQTSSGPFLTISLHSSLICAVRAGVFYSWRSSIKKA